MKAIIWFACLVATSVASGFAQPPADDASQTLLQQWIKTFGRYKNIDLTYTWVHRGKKFGVAADTPATDANVEDIVNKYHLSYADRKFDYRVLLPDGSEAACYKYNGSYYQDLSSDATLVITKERSKLEPTYSYENDNPLVAAHRFMLPGGTEVSVSDLANLKTWLDAGQTYKVAGPSMVDGMATLRLSIAGKARQLQVDVCPALEYLPLSWTETTAEGGDIGHVTKVFSKTVDGAMIIFPARMIIEGTSPDGKKNGYVDSLEVDEASIVVGGQPPADRFNVSRGRAQFIRDLDLGAVIKDQPVGSFHNAKPLPPDE